jgi:hypothetical protein
LLIQRFSLLLLISILPGLTIAQNKGDFTIGPIFGINYVTVVGDGVDSLNQQMKEQAELYNAIDGVSSSGGIYSRTGFNAGFSLDYYFIDNVAFCTGLSYSQKGFIEKNALEITIGLDYKKEEKKRINLNYFDFPLLLKYHLNNGIELSAGLLLSFLESDKVLIESTETYQTNDSISGNIITITEHTSDRKDYDDIVDDNEANALLTGFQIGVSYTIKRLNFSLNLNKNNRFGVVAGKGKNSNIVFQLCTRVNF